MPLGETLSEESILAERAKALVPLLDAEAEFADVEGELSPAAVEALHRDGLLRIWVPEKLGGAELDPVHSLEVLENLSYADASKTAVGMPARSALYSASMSTSPNAENHTSPEPAARHRHPPPSSRSAISIRRKTGWTNT